MDYYITSVILGLISLFFPLLIMMALFIFIMRRKDRSRGAVTKAPHIVAACVFCYSLVPMLSVTAIPDVLRFRLNIDVNIIPFDNFFHNFFLNIDQYLLNIALFIPFGFLLPMLWTPFEDKKRTLLCGFLFSLAIELAQLFSHRLSDINDLLMNSAGAIIGWFLFMLVKKLFPGIRVFAVSGDSCWRWEPYVYIAFVWFAVFFISPFTSALLMRLIGAQPVFQ
jgi:glycopeptide antibiotics resistance protein